MLNSAKYFFSTHLHKIRAVTFTKTGRNQKHKDALIFFSLRQSSKLGYRCESDMPLEIMFNPKTGLKYWEEKNVLFVSIFCPTLAPVLHTHLLLLLHTTNIRLIIISILKFNSIDRWAEVRTFVLWILGSSFDLNLRQISTD